MEKELTAIQGDLSEHLKKMPLQNTPVCEKHNRVMVDLFANVDKKYRANPSYHCSKCDEESCDIEKEKYILKEQKEKAAKADRITAGEFMGIPARFKLAKLSDFSTPHSFSLDESVLISGGCGTGKTHLAVALAKAVYLDANEKGVEFPRGRFCNFQELTIKVKSSFHGESESMSDLLADYIKDFRIIDDICTSKPTETAIESLYSIVNTRYEYLYPTIYTTNLSLEEISNLYGDRIASRLTDCRSIKLNGKDRRLGKREAA